MRPDRTLIALALKLVQPALLGDVVAGVRRLIPTSLDWEPLTEETRKQLSIMRDTGLVKLYEGRRYMLTQEGQKVVRDTGLGLEVDARRMFLLKETRRSKSIRRGGTRDRSLQQ